MPNWAELPPDALRAVLAMTRENPLRHAGVCKGWAWVLDDESFRAYLAFTYTPGRHCTLQEAARSFATFVCRREPVTRSLVVWLRTDVLCQAVAAANTALAAALTHLAPNLASLTVEPSCVADVFTGTPCADLCARLVRLHTHVNAPVFMGHLRELRTVDICLSGDATTSVTLPHGLETCRVRVHKSAPPHVVDGIVAQVSCMRALDTLAVETQNSCAVDLRRVPPSVRVLTLAAPSCAEVPCIRVVGSGVELPRLEVLGMCSCEFPAGLLSALLRAAPLRALQLCDYTLAGELHHRHHLDVSHKPLVALTLLSNRSGARVRCVLPHGIVKATLGINDLEDALCDPAFCSSVQSLALDLWGVDAELLEALWPKDVRLPRLQRVAATGCRSTAVAAKLGQRCAHAEVDLDAQLDFDVEVAVPAGCAVPAGSAMTAAASL